MKKIALAISMDTPATPPKPRMPAINATIRNVTTQLNMIQPSIQFRFKTGTADRRKGIFGAVDGKDRSNSFPVPQRPRQRNHPLDMTVSEPAAAIAANEREAARDAEFFLLHMIVERTQHRLPFQQQ